MRRLAAGTVEVEDLGPLEIRGLPAPIWTWRAVRPVDAPKRVAVARLIGREEELELLENALARAVRDRRATLVTVFGEPGIGKTRLVGEFVEGVERVTSLTGRSLPYGEGVTYWPLAAMIKASAGITDDAPASEAFERLRLCCESEAVADLLAVALGVLGAAENGRSASELTWAVTLWAEQLAEAQPLVLVFEDVHWAEEPLLGVVEHLARALRDSPVLIVCVARPDLLETAADLGRRQPTRAGARAGPADGRPEPRAGRRAARRRRGAVAPSGRWRSRRPRATRCSSRRRRGCSSTTRAGRRGASPTPSRP